jgi:predicted N-acetyltransferase YhbS
MNTYTYIYEFIYRRAKKREEVPYLGNVAVNNNYRRKGVGMKLIRVGLKVSIYVRFLYLLCICIYI